MTGASNKLTYDDYCLIPDDGKRHEIIDGEHYVNAAPSVKHQRVLTRILIPVANFVNDGLVGEVFVAPLDTVLSEVDVVQPDMLFTSKERLHLLTDANLRGTPDLVVEVLSPSNRAYDEKVKKQRYDVFGVAEYWIVDPEQEWIRIYRCRESGLATVAELRSGDNLTTPLLPGFSLEVELIFDL